MSIYDRAEFYEKVTFENYIPTAKQALFHNATERYKLFGGGIGSGKDIHINELVLCEEGLKKIEDIKVGERVYGVDGELHAVYDTSPIFTKHNCYKITFGTGEEVIAGEGHLWATLTHKERKNNARRLEQYRKKRKQTRKKRGTGKKDWLSKLNSERVWCYLEPIPQQIRTTKQLFETQKDNHTINVCSPIKFSKKELPIHPYILGLWLGDGTSNGGQITIGDQDVCLVRKIQRYGRDIKKLKTKYQYALPNFTTILRQNNLKKNKHIPENYLTGSIKQRLELLQGLLDSDGCCGKNHNIEFCNKNKNLMDGLLFLLRTFGIKAVKKQKQVDGVVYGRCCFTTSIRMFKIARKYKRQNKKCRTTTSVHYITKVEIVPTVKTKCISITGKEQLFLCTPSLIPTHNSISLCAEGIRLSAEYPNNCGYICRKTLRDFKRTTQVTLFEMLPVESIKSYNKTEGEIRLKNNSLIFTGDLEYTDKLKSLNLGWFAIDEASETNDDTFQILASRLRRKLPGIQYYGLLASNPEPGWLKDRFYDPQENGKPKPDHIFIQALPRDNPHLPEDYETILRRDMRPELVARFLDGSWEVFDNQIFDSLWIKESPRPMPEIATVMMAVDPAIGEKDENDETAIAVMGIDYDNNIHELEVVHGRWSFGDIVAQCIATSKRWTPVLFGVEVVAFQKALCDALKDHDLPVLPLKVDKDKVRRALYVSDLFQSGRVHINTYEAKKQLLEFPKGRLDDIADSIIHVTTMIKKYAEDEYKKPNDPMKDLKPHERHYWELKKRAEEDAAKPEDVTSLLD